MTEKSQGVHSREIAVDAIRTMKNCEIVTDDGNRIVFMPLNIAEDNNMLIGIVVDERRFKHRWARIKFASIKFIRVREPSEVQAADDVFLITRRLRAVFWSGDTVLILPLVSLDDGSRSIFPPAVFISSRDDLGFALRQSLKTNDQRFDETISEDFKACFRNDSRIGDIDAFMAEASLVLVEENVDEIIVMPTQNHGRSGGHAQLDAASIHIEKNASASILGETVLRAFENCS